MFKQFGQDILESETERLRQVNLINIPNHQTKEEKIDDGRVVAPDSFVPCSDFSGIQCSGTYIRSRYTMCSG